MKQPRFDWWLASDLRGQKQTAYQILVATSEANLAADKAVKYDVIIHTMDATRGDALHPLFPDVAFAAIL